MIDQDFSYINNFLAGLTLDDLKLFTIYMVANRDLNYIPLSAEEEDGFENTLTQLVDTRFSPVSVRFSGIYNKKIPAANRTAAIEMANEFRTTFKDRIKKLSWMGDESKAKAIEKLDNMDFGIGWPEDDSKRVEWSVKAPAASYSKPRLSSASLTAKSVKTCSMQVRWKLLLTKPMPTIAELTIISSSCRAISCRPSSIRTETLPSTMPFWAQQPLVTRLLTVSTREARNTTILASIKLG